MMLIPKQYCDHEYECIHFDGRYRCRHCGDVCYHGVNGRDPTPLQIEDMTNEILVEKIDLDALLLAICTGKANAVTVHDTLVSMANRIRELEDDRDSWAEQASQRVADWQREHDLRVAAEQRVGELERASQTGGGEVWQPIETAPKDGTEILLIATRYSMLYPHPEILVGFYRSGWWSGTASLSHLTHWMPLPAAPAHGGSDIKP